MSKKVSFGTKPEAKSTPPVSPDEWVENRGATKMKRLTIDLPESLHRRVKTACAKRGTKMVDEIRKLLEERFPEQ